MEFFHFIGVDIAKKTFDAVLLQETGPLHKAFENTPSGFSDFLEWLNLPTDSAWVCMESTGHYGEALSEYLVEKNIRVSVVNPLQIKHFGHALLTRNKNDRVDAEVIAEYAKRMRPRLFLVRSEEQKELRERLQLIDSLKKQRTQLKQQRESIRSERVREWYDAEIAQVTKRIEARETALNQRLKEEKPVRCHIDLLKTISGIGEATACRLVAYLPELQQFRSAKQLAAFIGLSPRQHESGQFRGKSRMSRYGHARLRSLLYMPALTAKQHGSYAPFVRRLEQNGLSKKAIIGALMRKLAHIIFGVLRSGNAFDPTLACAPL